MADLTQLPSNVNLSFVAGDTFRIRVRVLAPESGEPVSINPDTGATGEPGEYFFRAQIAMGPDRSIVSEFEVTADPEAPTEAVILTLQPSETTVLPGLGNGDVFQGIWDLEVTFPNGDVRTVAAGSVTCVIDVSHALVTP